MSLYILAVITGSIILFLYFLSGVFYVIQKPQIIINRKLYRIQKKHSITSINDYLNNLGKSNIYISILFLLGFIVALYIDQYRYKYSSLILLVYAMFINVLQNKFERKIKKYLVDKNTETID